jgi:Gpi18-like mannosyltransferase
MGNTSHTGMITSLTGLNEAIVNTVNVSVYPNPSADYIFIDFGNQNASKMSLNIYNCSGALVYNTSSYSGESINVGGFANGIYFVDINDGANSYRTTFYKN